MVASDLIISTARSVLFNAQYGGLFSRSEGNEEQQAILDIE